MVDNRTHQNMTDVTKKEVTHVCEIGLMRKD